eukprot:SAG22_NODE_69_length_22779_cov_71.088139_3_plen_86_part_00
MFLCLSLRFHTHLPDQCLLAGELGQPGLLRQPAGLEPRQLGRPLVAGVPLPLQKVLPRDAGVDRAVGRRPVGRAAGAAQQRLLEL